MTTHRTRMLLIGWAWLVVVIAAVGTQAAVPQEINFQGRLLDSLGSPVPDNAYRVFVRIYDSETAGSLLWEEGLTVSTENGLFGALLGQDLPIAPGIFDGSVRWIALQLEAQPESSPRIPLVSVPYALRAGQSDAGGGWVDDGVAIRLADSTNLVGIGTTNPTRRLHVSDSNALFLVRYQSGNLDATAVEYTNLSSGTTWEHAVAGSNGAFGGQVPAGTMYFYRQGTGGPALEVNSSNQVLIGTHTPQPATALTVSQAQGNGVGIYGESVGSGDIFGVHGHILYGIPGSAGVYGSCADGSAPGGLFEGPGTGAEGRGEFEGLRGRSASSTGNATGVLGQATEGVFQSAGVAGEGSGAPMSIGVYGAAQGSGTNYGIYATAVLGAVDYAGWFEGNVHVNGTLSKSAGSFRIDHPLDPENKYLQHSFVESPEMKNVYDGTVVTDAAGRAEVDLPDWFESLNRDFRYQLTVIGDFAQAVVSDEVRNNRFAIRTDKPGVKVSWQVTGVRRDPYARAHPIAVELDKTPQERGKYLHPELHGQASEAALGYVKSPGANSVAHRQDRER